jgi:hypothetical protein
MEPGKYFRYLRPPRHRVEDRLSSLNSTNLERDFMGEKRMLIMPAEVIRRIDENRGDMSQAEFIDFLIDSQLKEEVKEQEYASKEEVLSLIDSRLEEKTKEQEYAGKEEVLSLIDSKLEEKTKEQQYVSKEEVVSLIDDRLKEEAKEKNYVTREEIKAFEQDIKSLLKTFLDFFVSYGLELGKQSPKAEFEELSGKLEELESHLASEGESKEAKIKWK